MKDKLRQKQSSKAVTVVIAGKNCCCCLQHYSKVMHKAMSAWLSNAEPDLTHVVLPRYSSPKLLFYYTIHMLM